MVSTQRNTEEIFGKGSPLPIPQRKICLFQKGIDIQAEKLSADLILTRYPCTAW